MTTLTLELPDELYAALRRSPEPSRSGASLCVAPDVAMSGNGEAVARPTGLTRILSRNNPMLAQIEINDDLIQAAMKATGLGSETETVEAGLKLLLRQQGYARLLELGGKLQWEDNGTEPQESHA